MRQLPGESVVYFGDTARVPYGPKSPDTVTRYSLEISDFLQGEGVKAIVVACNTATAHALPVLQARLSLPVVGVIAAGAAAAAAATRSRKVGVIGTTGTISSGAYEREIRAADAAIAVTSIACPLFVPFAEEGLLDHEALRLIARDYLASLAPSAVDTLVLGCTHYPLLTRVIREAVGDRVRLIDSAERTAADTAAVLRARGLANLGRLPPRYRFIASDAPDTFLRVGQRFLGSTIDRVETVTLG